MNSHKFFRNTDCEYFPCHASPGREEFNCLFCFCPLMPDPQCGGRHTFTKNGVKDCSQCDFPHIAANYDKIMAKLTIFLQKTAEKRQMASGSGSGNG